VEAKEMEIMEELRKIVKEKEYILDYKIKNDTFIIDIITYFDIAEICTEKILSNKYKYEYDYDACVETMMEEINIDYAIYNKINIEKNDYDISTEPIECEHDDGCYVGGRIIVKIKNINNINRIMRHVKDIIKLFVDH